MKKQDPRLFSLAQEWARLRQDALIDREPAKIAAILETRRIAERGQAGDVFQTMRVPAKRQISGTCGTTSQGRNPRSAVIEPQRSPENRPTFP